MIVPRPSGPTSRDGNNGHTDRMSGIAAGQTWAPRRALRAAPHRRARVPGPPRDRSRSVARSRRDGRADGPGRGRGPATGVHRASSPSRTTTKRWPSASRSPHCDEPIRRAGGASVRRGEEGDVDGGAEDHGPDQTGQYPAQDTTDEPGRGRMPAATSDDMRRSGGARPPAGDAGSPGPAAGIAQAARAPRPVTEGPGRRTALVLRGAPPRPAAGPATGGEAEVLTLVGAGRSNSEIPAELVTSLPTVKSRIRHIPQAGPARPPAGGRARARLRHRRPDPSRRLSDRSELAAHGAVGFASSWVSVTPVPVSTPSTTTPVVNGPCRQPLLVFGPSAGPCGSGKTDRRWVAARAGPSNGG